MGIIIAKNLIIAGLLLSSSVSDLKSRTISLYPALCAGLALILCVILDENATFAGAMCGMAVGGILYAISRVTGGKIGEGDACVLSVTGIGAGLWKNLQMLCVGLVFAAVLSGILLITRTVNRNTKLPFIPFVFAGYLIVAPM